jgi:hypothetical protein
VVGAAVDTREIGGVSLVSDGVRSILPPIGDLKIHPAIAVKPWDSKPSATRQFIAHPQLACRNYGCHNNSAVNLIRAVNERVFYVKGPNGLVECPRGNPGAWLRLDSVSKKLASVVLAGDQGVKELTCAEFIAQCPSHKRNLYSRAAEEYSRRGVVKRDCRLGSFVKFEKVEFRREGPKQDPCPRLIQPRSPVFNVALGRYTRRVEEELYRALAVVWKAEQDELIVMKGLTVEDVGRQLRLKWDKYDHPVAVGLDASRFDQHVSAGALKWEHSIYNRVFKSEELEFLLKQQLRNRGSAFADGVRIDYVVEGTRSSGDMNTGLGNCLIMSALVLQYISDKGIKASLANNGDDCLVFMEARDLAKFSAGLDAWFLEFGFEMEVEPPCYVFEECEFCQMHPVSVAGEWVMVRSPMAALSKDSMMLGFPASQYPTWLNAVGTAGSSLYGDMPIYNVLYERFAAQGRATSIRSQGAMETGFFRMVRRARQPQVSDGTRISFARAFGISPYVQSVMEDWCRGMELRIGTGRFTPMPVLHGDR